MEYLLTFALIITQMNVGKYTIHGAYGYADLKVRRLTSTGSRMCSGYLGSPVRYAVCLRKSAIAGVHRKG